MELTPECVVFHPQGKDPVWLKIETPILTVRRQGPARQQGEVTSGPSHLLRSPRHLRTHTHPQISTYSCVHCHLCSDAASVPEERAEAFVTTPDRGADNPRRRVHHRLPGGGGRGCLGPGVGGHSGQLRGSSGGQQSSAGLGDPPSRPREHPASHMCTVHGRTRGRRAQEGAGSRLQAPPCMRLAIRVSWLRWGHRRSPP